MGTWLANARGPIAPASCANTSSTGTSRRSLPEPSADQAEDLRALCNKVEGAWGAGHGSPDSGHREAGLRLRHRLRRKGGQPLTVLCSLRSRAGNTPLAERRRADRHVLDRAGNVIADPAADAAANVFERNPNLNFGHWGEYWRKVHGVRFIHAESDGRSPERLLRYGQLHRFAPDSSHTAAPPAARESMHKASFGLLSSATLKPTVARAGVASPA